jgi:hypothetical protein
LKETRLHVNKLRTKIAESNAKKAQKEAFEAAAREQMNVVQAHYS